MSYYAVLNVSVGICEFLRCILNPILDLLGSIFDFYLNL